MHFAGMSKIAILVRHGESEANVKNIASEDTEVFPLTEKGKDQAYKTGLELKFLKGSFDQIFSSPVLRARETAHEFLRGVDAEKQIKVLEYLKETSLGKFNNGHASKLPTLHKEEFGIESFLRNGERMSLAIKDRNGLNIYFSHMIPIKAVVCKYLRMEEEEAEGIHIKNASFSIINVESEEVISIGSTKLSDNLRKRLVSLTSKKADQ